MDLSTLKELYHASPFGFAYHKISYGPDDTPEDYTFLYVNPAFEELTGLSSKKVSNRPVTQVLPGIRTGDFDWVEFYGKIVSEGRQEVFEQYSQPLGRWYKVQAFPIDREHFCTVFLDITEERRPMEVLKNVLNTVPDLISVQDAELNILYSNWSGFGGIPEEKRILGAKCFRAYRGYEEICPDCQLRKVLQTKKPFQTEVKLPDGTWVDLRFIPILNEEGDGIYFTEWVRVITDRKKMEIDIREKNRELNASNEEMEAINEELLYTNESLVKAKEELNAYYEELEAMNEELVNLNHELESSNKQLQASEERLRTLFQSMTEHVALHELVFDDHGVPVNYRILGCNRRFTEVTGITEEQAMGKLATEVYGTTEPPYLDVYAPVAMQGVPHQFETYFPPMDKHFSISAVSTGKNRFATITIDITEQKRIEDMLRESEEKHRRLFETMSPGVVYHAADGRIISANPSAERLLGLRLEQMLGKTSMDPRWKMILPDGTKVDGNDHPAMIALRTGKKVGPVTRGVYHADKDTHIWLSITAIPLFEPGSDKPFQAYATFDDVSERKRTEEQVIRAKEEAEVANKAKSQFLANMSHELRTPLNGVIGFTELLQSTLLNSEQQEYLGYVLQSAKNLLEVVARILEYIHIQSDAFQLHEEETDLQALCQKSMEMVRFQARQKGLVLSCHTDPVLQGRWMADPMRLQEILLNLLGNAVKFTHEGSVHVSLSALEPAADSNRKRIRIAVRDTGIGIPKDLEERIFQPFEQADMSLTRKYGGTGMGIPVAQEILKRMQSLLHVDSQPGKGTTFFFDLSLQRKGRVSSRPSATQEEGLPPKAADSQQMVVLVVEDDFVNARLLTAFLEKCFPNARIQEAQSGEEAVAAYPEIQPDIVLMDIQMPGIDGFEATRQIRKIEEGMNRKVPIIAVTAAVEEINQERCHCAGMDDYLLKPLRFDEAEAKIRRWIRS